MALDSTLVRVAVTGGIFTDLTGVATPPTDAATVLSPGTWDELGYVTSDGITQSINQDVSDITAWQNGDTVRKIQSSHDVTYALSFLETNETVLEAYYGNHTAGHVEVRGDILPRLPWVIDTFDGDQQIRIVIPDGQITERGETVYVSTDALVYPVTITAYPVDGVKANIYYETVVSS